MSAQREILHQRVDGIDVFRLLAACSVISLHVGNAPSYFPMFSPTLEAAIRLTGRWAVPFFFLATGYFLGQKPGRSRAHVPLVRAVVILVIASLAMIPLDLKSMGARSAFEFLTAPDLLLRGGYYHLWFLSSLVLGMTAILVSDHYGWRRLLPALSCLAIAAYLLLGAYQPGGERGVELARHFSSVAFLYLGMLLSRRELSSREAWWLTFAGIVLQAVEAFLLTKYLHKPAADYQLLIGTVPFAVGMFGIAQRIRSNRGVAWLGRAGERYSLGIYVFHPYVLYVLGRIATRLGQEHSLAFGVAIVPMAFVFTWLSLALVDRANPWFLDALRGDAHALRASPAPDAERVG